MQVRPPENPLLGTRSQQRRYLRRRLQSVCYSKLSRSRKQHSATVFLRHQQLLQEFIKHFSIKTANLRSLLKRDAKFVWNSSRQAEFDFLKQALTFAPILAFPNMQRDFILTTDACTSGIAYILSPS